MDEEELEEHAGEYCQSGASIIWLELGLFRKTYCMSKTWGSCPSLGSISLGSPLRHASSLV